MGKSKLKEADGKKSSKDAEKPSKEKKTKEEEKPKDSRKTKSKKNVKLDKDKIDLITEHEEKVENATGENTVKDNPKQDQDSKNRESKAKPADETPKSLKVDDKTLDLEKMKNVIAAREENCKKEEKQLREKRKETAFETSRDNVKCSIPTENPDALKKEISAAKEGPKSGEEKQNPKERSTSRKSDKKENDRNEKDKDKDSKKETLQKDRERKDKDRERDRDRDREREKDREREREKERDKQKEKDKERERQKEKEKEREREKERVKEKERERERDHKPKDHDRDAKYNSRDKDKRDSGRRRDRSRSRSRDRKHDKSKRHSRSRSKERRKESSSKRKAENAIGTKIDSTGAMDARKRMNFWEQPATGDAVPLATTGGVPELAASHPLAAVFNQMGGASQLLQSLGLAGGVAAAPGLGQLQLFNAQQAGMAVQVSQVTRTARRLYVGNVPAGTLDSSLRDVLNQELLGRGVCAIPGQPPIIQCSVNGEKSYAFIEFTCAEEATAALGLDGTRIGDQVLKIRRPKDYMPEEHGTASHPFHPMVSPDVPDTMNALFVGNIAPQLSLDTLKDLVTAFGSLASWHGEAGVRATLIEPARPGRVWFSYAHPEDTEPAVRGLCGMRLMNYTLVAVRMTLDGESRRGRLAGVSYQTPPHALPLLQTPQRVIQIQNVLSFDDLVKDELHLLSIEEDIRVECEELGSLRSYHLPRLPGWWTQLLPDIAKQYPDYVAPVEPAAPPQASPLQASSQLLSMLNSIKNINATPRVPAPAPPPTPPPASASALQPIVPTPELAVGASNEAPKEVDMAAEEEAQANGIKEVKKKDSASSDPLVLLQEAVASDNLRKKQVSGLGSFFVEFSRAEMAELVAHALHLREFGGQRVQIHYVPLSEYQKNFGKGLENTSHAQKQAQALAAHERLTLMMTAPS